MVIVKNAQFKNKSSPKVTLNNSQKISPVKNNEPWSIFEVETRN